MITNVTLSTKEQLLLQDQKTHEEQCILKYDNYANLAVDSQLKTILGTLHKGRRASQTINQLLNGQVPSMAGQSSQQQTGQQQTDKYRVYAYVTAGFHRPIS